MVTAPFVHRCIVQSGLMEGNKKEQDVTPYDIKFKEYCEECGELLATPEQIIAHIYEQLLEKD